MCNPPNSIMYCLKIIELSLAPPILDFPLGYGCGATIENAKQ